MEWARKYKIWQSSLKATPRERTRRLFNKGKLSTSRKREIILRTRLITNHKRIRGQTMPSIRLLHLRPPKEMTKKSTESSIWIGIWEHKIDRNASQKRSTNPTTTTKESSKSSLSLNRKLKGNFKIRPWTRPIDSPKVKNYLPNPLSAHSLLEHIPSTLLPPHTLQKVYLPRRSPWNSQMFSSKLNSRRNIRNLRELPMLQTTSKNMVRVSS
jgi:hypothetical protein